ncbi:carboxylesterase family protein [uncultured Maribacter sp.]|uniref:carboxylesterase/lipase family protein n=1 Tax=uncultured Maribacter sp. TaxID=431308 RepID=UPI0030D8C9CC|tara:strand:- start:4024 stop:5550 length:1527 start_codon:yes stop_codon:yes gene_type:complete
MKYLFILIGSLFIGCNQHKETVIVTDKGKIEGSFNADKTVRIFKGIPFAAPPVGDLRWKAPQPATDWDGILPCIEFGPSPIQNVPEPFYCWTEEFIAKPEPIQEDCLYLNVWTTAKSENEKQPVIVWIYGGGFTSGSANCDIYDGEELAKKSVVFVSINYRVGILGFMAHPELSKESGQNASGNYGFMDQIAALKWVQKNIEVFGGDPNNVTIAGQSAGAFSVNTLIASPLAKNIFHKAILQSGGLLGSSRAETLTEAEATGIRFMEKTEATSIEELRQLPAEEVQSISNDSKIGRVGITKEGYVVPKDLMAYFKNGKQHQIPIISGWVTGDGDFLGVNEMTVEEYNKEAIANYRDKAASFLTIFPADTNEDIKKMKSKLGMLNFAGIPSRLLAQYNTQPSYLYQFGHTPPDKPDFPNYGAFHTSEVPYALHTLHTWKRDWQSMDKTIEDALSSYWVNFAKTGNPNGGNLPIWNTYNKQSGNIMVIGDTTLSSKEGFLKTELDFLGKL